jgi:hypothetical protein
MFKLNWDFKVTQTILQIPYFGDSGAGGPMFQGQNRNSATPRPIPTTPAPIGTPTNAANEPAVQGVIKQIQSNSAAGLDPSVRGSLKK